ncbi:unnamed protein product [Rotaria magnacalcarata]|uniref:G-protein coupled receptors family 1 profile domain-containing protein n=1 Tax=Rotaria magnacalcarata TaxID=392030 RepID=A0A816VYX6_9BILA|nr:unnamed protein product [Rotaria magnacalcarata]CAF4267666.1 unnamed protein product [Rotaria magnacalcarata]
MNRFLCEPGGLMLNTSAAYHFSQTLSYISLHALPIIALATNSLILLLVLTNSRLNRSSFSVYVKSMAISDTLVLVFKLLSFENKTSTIFYSPTMCSALVFLCDASVLLSVWTIVLITVERALVVIFPIHIKKFVSECRARVLIMLIALMSVMFSSRVLLIPIDVSSEQKKRCHPVADWQNYRQINAAITEFSYCFIPLSIVIIGNCVTLYTVKRAIFQRHQILTNHVYHQKRTLETNESQLMLMLLIVTLMFMVYFLPFTITSLISMWGLPFGFCFTQKHFEHYLIIRSIFEFLKDLNFCTNFIIYCISGRRFRYAFFSLVHRRHNRLFSSLRSSKSTKQRTEQLLQQNIVKLGDINVKPTFEGSHL